MNTAAIVILIHQLIFQGMFLTKNILLRRRLGIRIRGHNREAAMSVGFIALFIIISLLFALLNVKYGNIDLLSGTTALIISVVLLAINVLLGTASLIGMRDSWRVGIIEDQKSELVEDGIYRLSRNPYFLSYLIMFLAYTILLQNILLFVLSLVGFVMIHMMIFKKRTSSHGYAW